MFTECVWGYLERTSERERGGERERERERETERQERQERRKVTVKQTDHDINNRHTEKRNTPLPFLLSHTISHLTVTQNVAHYTLILPLQKPLTNP